MQPGIAHRTAGSAALLLLLTLCAATAIQAQPGLAAPGAPGRLPGVAAVPGSLNQQIAYAAPNTTANGTANGTALNATAVAANCTEPCFVVKDYYPFKTCKAECNPEICARGFGTWKSQELCCSPGLAFPDGCSKRPDECWIIESNQLRTCVRDDRKCLQGYGVFASEELCCSPGAAFPTGCGNVTLAPEPCWVVDTYYPTKQCRQSQTLCDRQVAGVQSYATREVCCGPTGPFGTEGCSTFVPPVPCFVVDSYYPQRTCRQEVDVAVCYRGWGVYPSGDICCTPGAGFTEGCSAAGTLTNITTGLPGAVGASVAEAGRLVPAAGGRKLM